MFCWFMNLKRISNKSQNENLMDFGVTQIKIYFKTHFFLSIFSAEWSEIVKNVRST